MFIKHRPEDLNVDKKSAPQAPLKHSYSATDSRHYKLTCKEASHLEIRTTRSFPIARMSAPKAAADREFERGYN